MGVHNEATQHEHSNTSATSLPWYAIHVRSNCEQLVYAGLEGRGYETFFPTFVKRTRSAGRVKDVRLPLFRSYLFCRLDVSHRLPVLMTPGVVQIVSRNRVPVPVPDEEINAVKNIVASDLPYEPGPAFSPGQHVVVQRGPLMGIQGVLLTTHGPNRLLVSTTLLQRSVVVDIDSSWVQPVMDSLHDAAAACSMHFHA